MEQPWHYKLRKHEKEDKNLVYSCKNFQLLLPLGSPLCLSRHVPSVLFQALFLWLQTILLASQVCTCISILTWQEEYLCYMNRCQLETSQFSTSEWCSITTQPFIIYKWPQNTKHSLQHKSVRVQLLLKSSFNCNIQRTRGWE